MNIYIRESTPEDANKISQLASQCASNLKRMGDPIDFKFTADTYLRDGFGPDPAFSGLVAEVDGQVIGYLLYHYGYDTDRAIRLMYVIDLLVQEEMRGKGCGTGLMDAAARNGKKVGVVELIWSVYPPNQQAAEFYQRLGAHYLEDLRFMVWQLS